MRAVFVRGRFTVAEADAAAAVLRAYGIGLLAVVLIRSAVASFQAKGRHDDAHGRSPSWRWRRMSRLKLVLFRPFGAPGLAFATAIGAWINLVLLVALALRRGTMHLDDVFARAALATAAGAVVLANLLYGDARLRDALFGRLRFANEITLTLLHSWRARSSIVPCLLFGWHALGIRFADFGRRLSARSL